MATGHGWLSPFGRRAGAALHTVALLVCSGCALVSPTMKAPFKPDTTGDGNIVTGITIQEAMPLGLIVLMTAMMLKGAWTIWLSHRREMVRIKAAKK